MPTVELADTLIGPGGAQAEQTLIDSTANRFFYEAIDTTNMANGDSFRFRVYRKVLSAGSLVLWCDVTITKTAGVKYITNQGESASARLNGDVLTIVPLGSPHEFKFTGNQLAGAACNIPWSVEST